MLLDQHRKFVGCDLDSIVLMTAKSDVLSTIDFQVLSLKSDNSEDEEVRESGLSV